jgi:putative ABC transport system permease protein
VKAANTAQTVTGFGVPLGQLAVIAVLGALAGVVAGVRPAHRAARINVRAAIASE